MQEDSYIQPGDDAEIHAPAVDDRPQPRARPLFPGLPTGTGLGKYRILERIRTSHNAIIYKARDAMLDRLVTVKQLTPELIDNPVACGQFRHEAQLLAQIPRDNRHVIAIHEMIEEERGLFIVEEYFAGRWLETLISKRLIDPNAALRIIKSAAAGLKTLHGLHIVHRNIQPSNLLVSRRGQVKIANFASACREGNLTPPPMLTPRYTAPELSIGLDYDDRVDVYSLGFTFFEMLVGRTGFSRYFADILKDPITADTWWTVWHGDLSTPLPPAHEINSAVPREWSAVVQRMTAKHLDERYSSIVEGLAELEQLAPADAAPQSRRLASMHQGAAAGWDDTAPAAPANAILRPGRPVELGPRIAPVLTHTTTLSIRMDPSGPAAPITAADQGEPAAAAAQERTAMPRRQRYGPGTYSARSVPARLIPTPDPVVHTHKSRLPRLLAWCLACLLLTATMGSGIYLAFVYETPRHPIQDRLESGYVAYNAGDLSDAIALFQDAANMTVEGDFLRNLRDRAQGMIYLSEARLKLNQDDFETARYWLDKARPAGADRQRVMAMENDILVRKSRHELDEKLAVALQKCDASGFEQLLSDAQKQGTLDATGLLDKQQQLDQLRQNEAIHKLRQRAEMLLEAGEMAAAELLCRDAEKIKETADTRVLLERIRQIQQQVEWTLKGDEEARRGLLKEALSSFEEANRVGKPQAVIENKVKQMQAALLYQEALELEQKGDILGAYERISSSLFYWKSDECSRKLLALEQVRQPALLAQQADRYAALKNFDNALKYYDLALPDLPPAAATIVREKRREALRGQYISEGERNHKLGKFPEAVAAYREASRIRPDKELEDRIQMAEAGQYIRSETNR